MLMYSKRNYQYVKNAKSLTCSKAYCVTVGIIPLMPISTIVSPFEGSHFPSLTTSIHSKLWFTETRIVTTTSEVSFPVIFKDPFVLNWPVATQLPAGMGEVAKRGLTTVVAPTGAWPEVRKLYG